MYDFLVLPEFNESEFDLGYDNSNVVNAFPEVTDTASLDSLNNTVLNFTPFVGDNVSDTNGVTPNTNGVTHNTTNVTPNTTNVTNATATDFDPYYTYDAMAIDDVVFPSMMSPTMSSEGTSPTVGSSDSLFDDGFDLLNTNVNMNMKKMQMTPPLQTLHASPLSSVDVSPIACQPTPVHSRSQSYSMYGRDDQNMHNMSGVTPNMSGVTPNMSSVTHNINSVTPNMTNVTHDMTNVTPNMNHVTPNMNHVTVNSTPSTHNTNNVTHTHTHNVTDYEDDCNSPCASDDDSDAEELSLDDSPSAHGVLFKNLSSDEQTKYRKYHCPVCKKYFRRDLPRHLRIHQRVARFVCPYPRDQCSHKRGQFNRPYDYKKHLLHSHFQFDEAKLVRGFRDLKSKLTHYGTCNCGRRFRADKWLDDHVMKCLKENGR